MKYSSINLLACINSLGYGNVGTNICKSLCESQVKVNLFPLGPVECSERNAPLIKTCLQNSEAYEIDSPSIRIYHQFDLCMHVGRSLRIGWPIFELDEFTRKEQHQLKSCDAIIVCSEWAKSIVSKINPNVHVVPLGFDPIVFNAENATTSPTKTVFLNMGKWEVRKGHDVLVTIFNKAFNREDSVELWMCNHNPFYSKEENESWARLYKESPLGDKIRIIPRLNDDISVAHLMKKVDCGIFPSRAEGWNLEALEMLACGKQVIATNYAGHTQFLNKQNSILVDINSMEPAFDGKWFFRQGNWAFIGDREIDYFATYMRAVHKKKMNGIVEKVSSDFTWANSANKLIEVLQCI